MREKEEERWERKKKECVERDSERGEDMVGKI